MNSVEEQMYRDIRRMTPEVNRMVALTRGIPALSAQHTAALEMQGHIRARLGGDSSVGGLDDFNRRRRRIERQVNGYYARHPDAALPPPQTTAQPAAEEAAQSSRGGAAGVREDVLATAMNMLTGFETMVFHGAGGAESIKVIEYLQDIGGNRRMDPVAIEAARQADNDAATLVDNLLALVRHDPPILSYNTRW